jgi:hypothetical protein
MTPGRCLGIALLAVAPLAAQPADSLDAKVRALAHPRYAEREKAARDLEAIGEPALKALREVAGSNDEELRARAAVVADRIERSLRSERLLVAPKLALKFDKTPLGQAVVEFSAKSQRHVILDKAAVKNSDRTVTLDTGEVPYWQAVEAFYRAAGLVEDDEPFAAPPPGSGPGPGARAVHRFQGPGVTNSIRLIDGQPGPVVADRAICVRALRPAFGQNKYDDIKGEVTFHLDVDPAPGLAVREIIGIEVRKAVTDDGRPLAAAFSAPPPAADLGIQEQIILRQVMVANGSLMVEGMPGTSAQAVTLKTDGLRPKKLAEFQGTVVARVITPPEPVVTVDNLLRPGTREVTAGAITLHVKEVTTGSGNRVTVQAKVVTRMDMADDDVLAVPIQMKGRVQQFIRINRSRGMSGPSHLPDLKVRDAAGVPIRGLSAQVTNMNFDGTTVVQDVKLTFEKPATPGDDALNLVLMGKRPAVVEMPFTLKDIPLP